jgi:hypothetical protein
MATTLTDNEKASIINNHLSNLYFGQYNIELSLKEENAKATPDEKVISNVNNQLADITKQIDVLNAELATLTITN